jgi:hypothetical protein
VIDEDVYEINGRSVDPMFDIIINVDKYSNRSILNQLTKFSALYGSGGFYIIPGGVYKSTAVSCMIRMY